MVALALYAVMDGRPLKDKDRQLSHHVECSRRREVLDSLKLSHRFLYGGLPPFFMSNRIPEKDFQEWIDAYWAKDIQELFRLEHRHAFQEFFELIMTQSGGIFEATRFSKTCEVSRTTIMNYLKVIEATFVMHVILPFSTHRATEIVSAPKVYGFDTGFVCYHRGITQLRSEDFGPEQAKKFDE